jgi:hypothetical protein
MLSPERIRFSGWSAGVALIAWLLIRGIMPGWNIPHSDFNNYYVSARLVVSDSDLDSLYNNEWFHEQMIKEGIKTPGKFAPFPPATAWLMLPLSGFAPLNAQRIFVFINVVFLFACARGWQEITGWKIGPSLLIVLAGGASITNNIAFGQVYLLMTAFLLWSVVWMRKQRPQLSGIVLGIFTAIKYFPAAPIGGLAVAALMGMNGDRDKTWRIVAWSIGTIALLIAAQLVFFGAGVMSDYFITAFLPHLSSELKGQGMYSFPFQSWDSLARNLFVFDLVANPHPWIDWAPGRTILKILVVTIVGTATLLAMYRTRKMSCRTEIYMAITSMATLAVLPASATYHFALLLLPLSLLIGNQALPRRTMLIAIGIYITIGFIPYGWFAGAADYAGLILAYPRLWLITFLFAIVAVALIRKRSTSAA